MTPDKPEEDPIPETPTIDPETLKDSIREVLGEILPDFLKKDDEDPAPTEIDDLDKPLTARSAEQMMKGLMKSAMAELQEKKPPAKATPKAKEDEPPAPKKEKEEPPAPPQKRFSLEKLMGW